MEGGREARVWTSGSQVRGWRLGWFGIARKAGVLETSGEGGVKCFHAACISGPVAGPAGKWWAGAGGEKMELGGEGEGEGREVEEGVESGEF